MKKKTLIIDCDGVIYPFSNLTSDDFKNAIKLTCENNAKIDGVTQQKISEKVIEQQKHGMFNYIKALCDDACYDFEEFCQQMFEYIDYRKIEEDQSLLEVLQQTADQRTVYILSNNHHVHLEKIFLKRFGKTLHEIEKIGIRCFDITTTEQNGAFYPKQDPEGLRTFLKKINKTPQECILIDDSIRNIQAAKNIEMEGVLIDEKYKLSDYLSSLLSI